MSEQKFKKGDRVRYTGAYWGWNDPRKIGWTGVVATPPDFGQVVVTWDGDDTPSPSVYADNLELVPYTPQVGDRVRLTVEGVVQTAAAGGKEFFVETESGEGWRVYGKADYTVELIEKAPEPPKPFGVGSVLREGRGFLFRTSAGWVRESGQASTLGDDFWRTAKHVTVIHEPPTS
jgi:hypothetical protein